MRPNAALAASNGNRGQGAGAGPAAPAASFGTPHRERNGVALDDLIRSLEAEWQLGLKLHGLQSPSQRAESLSGKVYGQIQFLHYSSPGVLHKLLDGFRQMAPVLQPATRLELLNERLNMEMPSKSRTGTPASSQGNRNVPPKTLKSAQPSASQGSKRARRFSDLFQVHQEGEPESHYSTAPEPGSPTDEDDDDFVTPPPSPTLSSRSAQRRLQASQRFSFGTMGRKRPSDSSIDSGSSPKLTKTGKGKQPADEPSNAGPSKHPSPPLFKKPSLDMARSFQAASLQSSFTRSFNTMWSSQETRPDTANTSLNTSFTSDACEAEVQYPRLTRTSSTTMGSLSDTDLLNVSSKLERDTTKPEKELSQELARESSSTFGSVDEDGLIETSFRVEAEDPIPRLPPLRPPVSPGGPTVRADSARGTPSPGKNVTRIQDPMAGPSKARPSAAHSLGANLSPIQTLPQPIIPPAGASSARFVPHSPQTPPANVSPSKLLHYIRDIPKQNLFVDELPDELKVFPYFILFICCRIAVDKGIPMRELMRGMDAAQVRSEPAAFWDAIQSHPNAANGLIHDPPKLWAAARREFEGYTFKGRLCFNRSGSTFRLELLPVQPERSCRFQRKFGAHRFLYLDLPPFETGEKVKPSRFTGAEMRQIQQQWKVWFEREHSFLGRKWRAFHIEPIKKKAGRSKDDSSNKRMIMFATEGIGIDKRMSIGEVIDWFFPFAENTNQPFCKAYARLDLGLSRTIPTLPFKPSQIRYVDDITADGVPEDSQYNDTTLSWDEKCVDQPVMNDGCSLISVGAASEIWKKYRKATDTNDPIPSAFQARIGGAKGVWMVCGEPSSDDPAQLEIWIQITAGQLKFQPHNEDLYDETPYDEHRLTFEYVNHSLSPRSSELHISFIPIMVDRGVPRACIRSIMLDRLDAEREQLLQILPDPVKMYHWVHNQASAASAASDAENPRWQAAMPHSLPDKIKLLLESGFYPDQEPYLSNTLYRFIKQRQVWMEQKLRVPLGKAANLLGVADPLGVLAPGEVHVDFSSPFVDEFTGSTYRALNNVDVLVARQPACRRSDIQRARAVKHPELAHLVDLVVFPTRGEYPMAGKLQGGDYDGDIFWLCWESALVEPFKNAPAPLQSLDPTKYGIRTDKRKLHEVMKPHDLSTVDDLLREVLEFRMTPSLLGMVTNFLEKQAYKENRIYSDRLTALCDMHDLLVDAPKQGYLFNERDYRNFTQFTLCCGKPKDPAYKQAMTECERAKELGEADKIREKDYRHKKENVLDFLYFEVVRTHDVATLKSVSEAFPKDAGDDPAVQFPYVRLRDSRNIVIQGEMAALTASLTALSNKWARDLRAKQTLTSDHYNHVVDSCYHAFRALVPTDINLNHPDVKPWLEPYLYPRFSLWETIRASALYTVCPTKHAFVWHMAGRELCRLKCIQLPGAKFVTGNIFGNLKPKPIKVPKPEDDEESEDESQVLMEQA